MGRAWEQGVIEDVLSNKAMWHIEIADCLGVLRGMPSESVHTVITSPPYFNLRDYGTGRWEGGDAECDHRQAGTKTGSKTTLRNDGRAHTGPYEGERALIVGYPYKDVCGKCGARRIDQQIGLERTPQEFVGKLVEVFREVRRVLRSDGCAWVNMGDSYANTGMSDTSKVGGFTGDRIRRGVKGTMDSRPRGIPDGLKPKDLMGLPWRLAFALQEDGWYLRQDIIWHKPAPMPESVTDRCTKAHEYIFLLSKQERYYFDAQAISEGRSPNTHGGKEPNTHKQWAINGASQKTTLGTQHAGSNRRSVWSIPTEPLKDAHYAAYPTRLPELCLLAGTSARGCCPECGAQWRRVVERTGGTWEARKANGHPSRYGLDGVELVSSTQLGQSDSHTLGWQPSCTHAHSPIPSLVLDPFAGSGSTLIAALRNGRRALGIDISEEYGRIARRRLMGVTIPHPELVAV